MPIIVTTPRPKEIFFHVDNFSLIRVEDRRSSLIKLLDLERVLWNYIKGIATRMRSLLTKPYDHQDLPWTSTRESGGLIVLVHGLYGSTSNWKEYIKEFQKRTPTAHLFVPSVIRTGNCPLQVAAEPILEVIKNYLKIFPGKPLTLIGTSNGGRIIQYIEIALSPELLGTSPLSIVSLAGVHYGTETINFMADKGLLWMTGLDRTLTTELRYGGPFATQALSLWREKQHVWDASNCTVRHLFCATLGDFMVRNPSSSLPYHPRGTYHIFHQAAHNTIIPAAHHTVMQWLYS